MRKTFVAIIAASTMGVVWADASSQEQYQQQQFRDQPQARAYLSYSFGGDSSRRGLAAPLHYGLRIDYDSRLRQNAGVTTTPLLQFDHDNRGESMALASGIPFAARNLRRNEDSGSTSSGGGSDSGGWTFFDWTLLAVGIGGAGYLIYDATKGHNSPDAKPASSGSTTSGSTTGGGLLGTGLLGFAELQTSYDADRDFQQQHWLDGGTGQMGDLGGK